MDALALLQVCAVMEQMRSSKLNYRALATVSRCAILPFFAYPLCYICAVRCSFFTAFKDRDKLLVEGGGVDVTRMRGRGFDWAGLLGMDFLQWWLHARTVLGS